jgi:hypothetical protein
VHRNGDLDTLAVEVVLNCVLDLLHTSFQVNLFVVWLVKVIIGYVINITIVSDSVAHLFHFESAIID